MNGKMIIAGSVSLLAGLLVARIGVDRDLALAKSRIRELERDIEVRAAPAREDPLVDVRALLALPPPMAARGDPLASPPAPREEEIQAEVETDHQPAAEKLARNAWQLRTEMARKSFVERLKLDERQELDFGVLVEAMNLRLGTAVDRWAERIEREKSFTPEIGVRMVADLSQALAFTYDEFDRKLPTGWREAAGGRFELVSLVDPEVLTPLMGIKGLSPPDGEADARNGIH